MMNPFTFSNSPKVDLQNPKPLALGIAGLTHDHVRWILAHKTLRNIQIVGIAETNKALSQRYAEEFSLNSKLMHFSLPEMLDTVKPQAVCAFGSILEHVEVVRQCAPRGIHVMVEKPLAFKKEHALEMESLAAKHEIFLLTNFQTSWFSSTHFVNDLAFKKEALGDVWKVVFHDGHNGPIERGCSMEFTTWLAGPQANGGGALIDFGCYGPNILTWMMKGEKPLSVTAVAQSIKPEKYPNVDDEAVIILEYSKAQAVIQASWNWPISRKDIEVYGKSGQAIAEDSKQVRVRKNQDTPEEIVICPPMEPPFDDPFAYFAAVVAGNVTSGDYDLPSLKLNVVVAEILEAAILSAETGKKIYL